MSLTEILKISLPVSGVDTWLFILALIVFTVSVKYIGQFFKPIKGNDCILGGGLCEMN
jgi:hypothetical protein